MTKDGDVSSSFQYHCSFVCKCVWSGRRPPSAVAGTNLSTIQTLYYMAIQSQTGEYTGHSMASTQLDGADFNTV